MYVETGITRISVQLSSDAGNTFYEITEPTTGEWISHETLFAAMNADPGALDPSTLKFIGLQLWGEAGKAIYVDNIYFTGEAVFSDLAVTVKDSSNAAIAGAVVSVGSTSADSKQVTTDANGLATFNIPEGEHNIYVRADGMATAKQLQSNVGGGAITVAMEALNPAPSVAAPNPTISNADAYVLYSDALTLDNYISFWEDNWWNAPTFSAVKIAGNNTARFQITPDGVSGGVTGIQYGIEGGVVDASDKVGVRFDMYATSGVTKAVFQVVSATGPGISAMESLTTGEWISVDLVFDYLAGDTFDPATLSQFGLQLFGTTKDTVYLDNIYFY